MSFKHYSFEFVTKATNKGLSPESIESLLKYAEKLYINDLPIIYNRKHLSTLIQIKTAYLNEVIENSSKFYKKFEIPKKNGKGNRIINSPFSNLRFVQNWILKKILYKKKSHINATAYIKGKSLKDNLQKHLNQQIVLKLDVNNFFDSLNENLVANLFESFGFTPSLSNDLAKICCLNNSLPQGASTSAYISNLLLLPFDTIISEYCDTNKVNYSRYADDLTFSGNFNCNEVINKVSEELNKISTSLKLNLDKKQIMYSYQKQYVTGVIVNKKMQLDRSTRNHLRMINFLIDNNKIDDYISNNSKMNKLDYLQKLLGLVNFGIFLNPNDKNLILLKDKILNT